MTTHKFSGKALVISLVCFFVLIYVAGAKAEAVRIAVFPFQIHSAEDLEFMQAGLYDMLANRLGSADGSILVIPREEMVQEISTVPSRSLKDKSQITRTLQADYFISGSLTALGSNVSTDVQFFKVEQTVPLVQLSQTGTQGDIIAHIDQFAAQVNQYVFKRSPQEPLIAEESASDQKSEAPIGGLAVVKTDQEKTGRWQSITFKTHFKGVSIGDVDGNGTQEIVMIDQYRIYVFQYGDNRLVEVTREELGRHANILAVDVADINANGKAEMFVTKFARLSERPASLIYEYTVNDLSILDKDSKWFYRVQHEQDGRLTLTAQTKLIKLSASDKIQILRFKNGSYVGAGTITTPKIFNVYDMAFLHDPQTDNRVFVGYDHNNEISAWSEGGNILWESGEPAGGSLNYIEYSDQQSVDKIRHYLSKRVLLADTDENGKPEFVAIKNINSSPEWMTKARRYNRGYITCVEWDSDGALKTKWKTEEERGYISDMALGDVTNDGKLDLVFTVVSDVKRKLEKSSSYLVIQQLP